jgi:hypothetical protein
LNHDFHEFLRTLNEHSIKYNHCTKPKVFLDSEYIEVMIPTMSQGVAAMRDWLGEHGTMQVTYLDDDNTIREEFEQYVSYDHMANVLRNALGIDILGNFH